jgi:hypothetical protein
MIDVKPDFVNKKACFGMENKSLLLRNRIRLADGMTLTFSSK